MFSLIRKYPLAVLGALLVHVVFIGMLVLSFDWTARPVVPPPEIDIVKATIVDERAIATELAALRESESKKKRAENDRVQELESQADLARSKREQEQLKLAELESQHKVELERKHKAEKERTKAEQERAKAEVAARQAQLEQRKLEQQRAVVEAERLRVESDRKLAEEQSRRVKEEIQRAEEQKRRLEDERIALETEQRKRVEEEKRKSEELARKQKADARREQDAQRRNEEDELRRKQLVDEEKRQVDKKLADRAATITLYKNRIYEKVTSKWLRTLNAKEGMSSTVSVHLMPDGSVRDVKTIKSSGDAIFDREVENAVKKADPLPVPPDPAAFVDFKEITFEFKPKVK